jgi:L-fuconolactonase
MRIDAHQHFWHYIPEQYTWIRHPVLKRDYAPEDLLPLMKACGFEGTVAVQARTMLEETRWLLELAESYPFIKGVVGWADLCDAGLAKYIARYADNPLFCGIRTGLRYDSPDIQNLDADFLVGMAVLGEYDTAFDILIRPAQLKSACALAELFPNQVFVLDHIANPPISEHVLDPWTADMRRLASYPNVYCKVSGMVTRADHDNWRKDDILPYLNVVYEAFSAERLMIGSDWPVCTQAATYQQTMDIVLDFVANLSSDEQEAVLGKTAARAYNLRV